MIEKMERRMDRAKKIRATMRIRRSCLVVLGPSRRHSSESSAKVEMRPDFSNEALPPVSCN